MTGVGDLNRGNVTAAFDPPRAMDFEQLRVQRPAVELKNQFRDARADR
jgi:hypothetical protein